MIQSFSKRSAGTPCRFYTLLWGRISLQLAAGSSCRIGRQIVNNHVCLLLELPEILRCINYLVLRSSMYNTEVYFTCTGNMYNKIIAYWCSTPSLISSRPHEFTCFTSFLFVHYQYTISVLICTWIIILWNIFMMPVHPTCPWYLRCQYTFDVVICLGMSDHHVSFDLEMLSYQNRNKNDWDCRQGLSNR